jgi:Flp pilus assembly protein TadB
MNRQMRRIQKKAEERQNEERDRLKSKRREKRQRVLSRRRERLTNRASGSGNANTGLQKDKIGRFTNFIVPLVIVFIILQAILPRPEAEGEGIQQFSLIIEVLYYTLFSYFGYLWLAKRNIANAFPIAGAAGAVLAALLQGLLYLLPNLEPNLQLLVFAIPASVLGAFLAQLVYSRAA